MQRLPLGLEDRPAAVPRLAGAGEAPLPRRRVRLVELEGVVVGEFLARHDVPDGHDLHMVAIRDRLAIRFTGVVDEPRRVPAHVGVDDPMLVERKQVRVLGLLVAVRRGGVAPLAFGLADELARVLDDLRPRRDDGGGIDALAVPRRGPDDPGARRRDRGAGRRRAPAPRPGPGWRIALLSGGRGLQTCFSYVGGLGSVVAGQDAPVPRRLQALLPPTMFQVTFSEQSMR